MKGRFTPKIVTANALLEGDVVYLTEDGRWSRRIGDAELIEDEAHAQVRLVEAAAQTATVVGVYLADAAAGADGRPEPLHFRETFRARGPSVPVPGRDRQAGG